MPLLVVFSTRQTEEAMFGTDYKALWKSFIFTFYDSLGFILFHDSFDSFMIHILTALKA